MEIRYWIAIEENGLAAWRLYYLSWHGCIFRTIHKHFQIANGKVMAVKIESGWVGSHLRYQYESILG
jgi:hypothetical protein